MGSGIKVDVGFRHSLVQGLKLFHWELLTFSPILFCVGFILKQAPSKFRSSSLAVSVERGLLSARNSNQIPRIDSPGAGQDHNFIMKPVTGQQMAGQT